jgi:hypothetical protein
LTPLVPAKTWCTKSRGGSGPLIRTGVQSRAFAAAAPAVRAQSATIVVDIEEAA